jgi:hypothetical protein
MVLFGFGKGRTLTMSTEQNKYIFPLYVKLLIDASIETQHMLISGDSQLAWESAKTFALLVREKEERTELDNFIREVENDFRQQRQGVGLTVADSLSRQLDFSVRYRQNARILYDRVLSVLEKHGYLKKISNIPIGKELDY